VQAKNQAGPLEWSLVERAIYGTKVPESGSNGDADKVKKIVFFFKEMYGAILLRSSASSGGASNKGEPYMQYSYLFPKWSVLRKVAAIRNGCDSDPTGGEDVGEQGTDCPVHELAMKYGVCPSLEGIIKNRPAIKRVEMQTEEVAEWFTEAGAGGYPASGEFVESLYAVNGNPTAEITEIKGKLKRVVDHYCDATALAAFTRYHTRLAAIVEDHLALNEHVTSADKAKVLSLVIRGSDQLQLAQADVAASAPIESISTGVMQAKDRKAAGYTSAVAEANQDTQRRASYTGALVSYGGPTYLSIAPRRRRRGFRRRHHPLDPGRRGEPGRHDHPGAQLVAVAVPSRRGGPATGRSPRSGRHRPRPGPCRR
jgi:hypothetical protein